MQGPPEVLSRELVVLFQDLQHRSVVEKRPVQDLNQVTYRVQTRVLLGGMICNFAPYAEDQNWKNQEFGQFRGGKITKTFQSVRMICCLIDASGMVKC